MTLTDELPQSVLFRQGVYLSEHGRVAGKRGPAEKQRKGLCAGQRLWVEGEPLGRFVGADGRPTMLQRRAESLQEQDELRGLCTQPDRTTEVEIPDQTSLFFPLPSHRLQIKVVSLT